MTTDKHQSPTTVALKPCPFCGSDCRTEIFDGPHIEGEVTLWICSNHKRFGGDCESGLAYLTAEAWNTRPSPIAEPQDSDAAWLRAIADPLTGHDFTEGGADRLERIAARLEAPIAEDALVEENRELRNIIAELGYCTPEASVEFMRLIPGEVSAALQAIHEKKG